MPPQKPQDPQEFATTHWSLVLAAKVDEGGQPRAQLALAELCRTYWYPLYSFVRYRGYSPEDAQDLTQSFFLRIIETGGFATADPEQGRFRSYLLGAMKHFLANDWHRSQAQKRGGKETFLELDALGPEDRFAVEAVGQSNPDAGFDRDWAREVVARAIERLRLDAEKRGKQEQFAVLKGCLVGDEPARQETATRLGMTTGALKVTIHRLRQRFRELLRSEVTETLSDPSDLESEMRHLMAALLNN